MDLILGLVVGLPVIVANYSVFLDDFNIDGPRNFYLTQLDRGIIFRLFDKSDTSTLLSELLVDLYRANACAFGTSVTDLSTLYILSSAVNRTFESGSILDKVDLSDILSSASKV